MDSFFRDTYKYLVRRIEDSLKSVNYNTMQTCLEILENGKQDKRVTIDGAGRSLQSALLLANELENLYGIRVNQVNNANLRPLRGGDVFIVNSRSGIGKSTEDAEFALKKGLNVIYITGNPELEEKFENVILIKGDINHESKYAPLGTEFEQASAVLCSCMGYAYNKSKKMEAFNSSCTNLIDGLYSNLQELEKQEKPITNYASLINDFLEISNDRVIYFKGAGINEIISRIIAIRYGHLHKEGLKDLHVVYEGHWKSRRKEDLAVLISGSGETDQILKYAQQAGDVGMKLFTITSFKESSLARTNKWYRKYQGNLIIEGRPEMVSYYNKSIHKVTKTFFPQFELNTYITLDALLALIAKNNDITEEDMKKTHRDKELE
ncbi:MAG: SIS domain-containing protein [Promethearchaeota archaeon]